MMGASIKSVDTLANRGLLPLETQSHMLFGNVSVPSPGQAAST